MSGVFMLFRAAGRQTQAQIKDGGRGRRKGCLAGGWALAANGGECAFSPPHSHYCSLAGLLACELAPYWEKKRFCSNSCQKGECCRLSTRMFGHKFPSRAKVWLVNK